MPLVLGLVCTIATTTTVQAQEWHLIPGTATNPDGITPYESTPAGTCVDGTQESGAVYRICMPSGANPRWNGDLVVYAHGYVPFYRDIGIPEDQMSLPGSPFTVDQIINSMGYAFATTSYSANGLAVKPAIPDLLELVDIFIEAHGVPSTTLLTGVSEGGLITTLAVERHPEVFDGGLAMCGPSGSFQHQVNHYGDFRVVFDYYFPKRVPGEPVTIPNWLIDTWETSYYTQEIEPVISDPANAPLIDQLLQVTGVSPYGFDPPASTEAMERLLWYNVYATMDGRAKLGGQPYGNLNRVYQGSNDDAALNAGVWRTRADRPALTEMAAYYETTGILTSPLVTLHNTGDYLVPYDHMTRYRVKVMAADNLALHRHYKVERHGHCNFDLAEVTEAFDALVAMVEDPPVYEPVHQLYIPAVQGGPRR
jgi:pimeloyl-ACP methyl ester carboxylesterase